jgi:hypothetical protein
MKKYVPKLGRHSIVQKIGALLLISLLVSCTGESDENQALATAAAATATEARIAQVTTTAIAARIKSAVEATLLAATPTITNTPKPPTHTPTPTKTPKPTNTPLPTNTPRPTATATPTITPTPISDQCAIEGAADLNALELIADQYVKEWRIADSLYRSLFPPRSDILDSIRRLQELQDIVTRLNSHPCLETLRQNLLRSISELIDAMLERSRGLAIADKEKMQRSMTLSTVYLIRFYDEFWPLYWRSEELTQR